MFCQACGYDLGAVDRIGRSDRCDGCGMDLHSCKNCRFYDEKVYNECSEPQAERVVDKEKSNFCDYFEPGINKGPNGQSAAEEARKKLEALFKK